MAFSGIFPAPDLTPSEFGLFSVSSPVNHTDADDKWIRGFSVDLESRPNFTRNWSYGTEEVVSTAPDDQRYMDVTPYFIEVEDQSSTFGILGVDRFKRVVRQLDAVTQKNVEHEFWEGDIAQGESFDTPFLRGSTCTVINSGTAMAPSRALALLEFSIGEMSAAGEQGIIHMTRDVAIVLSTQNLIRYEKGVATTRGGTPIVLGSGYTGTGPLSETTNGVTSITSRWMYATGTIAVHLGKSEVVNDDLGQGYDVEGNKNDMKIKANRPAAAYFDPSIHLAVKVDLS